MGGGGRHGGPAERPADRQEGRRRPEDPVDEIGGRERRHAGDGKEHLRHDQVHRQRRDHAQAVDHVQIDNYAYDAGKPDDDSASFNLVKGGLRSITGLLGKRNKERFALKTPTATIGIRGTTFIVDFIEPSEQAVAASRLAYWMASTAALGDTGVPGVVPLQLAQNTPAPPAPNALPPGLYVQVIDGLINVSNSGGSTNFAA